MIKIEQIVKPFNSGFSAVSIKYLLENLQKRYLVNIEPNITTVDAIKEKDNYFILVKVPSESNTEYKSDKIFYDVIIELSPPNKSYLNNESVRDYDVRVYSNCPSFTYTFTYVYYKKDALIKMPKGAYTRKALSKAPRVRNPLLLFGIEKTLWFAICYIDKNKLFKRSNLEALVKDDSKLKDLIKEHKIIGQDQKLEEVMARTKKFSTIKKKENKIDDRIKEKDIKKIGKTSPKKENIENLRSKLAADLSSDLNKPDIRKSILKSSLKSGLSKKK